jgi:hypothetical protein
VTHFITFYQFILNMLFNKNCECTVDLYRFFESRSE